MHWRPQFPGVLHKESCPLAQDPADVRLVQQHGHLNESVEGSDLRLLRLPAAKRWGRFNAKYCAAGTTDDTAKPIFRLDQTGHLTSPELCGKKAEKPAALGGRR